MVVVIASSFGGEGRFTLVRKVRGYYL